MEFFGPMNPGGTLISSQPGEVRLELSAITDYCAKGPEMHCIAGVGQF